MNQFPWVSHLLRLGPSNGFGDLSVHGALRCGAPSASSQFGNSAGEYPVMTIARSRRENEPSRC